MSKRTIAAVITPLGESGIGSVRISGPDAKNIADKVFRAKSGKKISDAAGYTALYGMVYNGEEQIDEAVALVFTAPKSYTGEDAAELSVHGGRYVVKALLRAVLSAGADLAEPGEFTKRAFQNGKLDLAQAESIMGIISAHGERDLKIQRSAREGVISVRVRRIREKLIETAANIAAYTDYPDEDLPELQTDRLGELLDDIKSELQKMLSTYDAGRVICEGISTVIAGRPNVGKSTLMNLLSGYDKSIVTDIPGTTRDVIEQTVMLGDIALHLSDTAGIHKTDDVIEKAGVKRAEECIDSAQLVLAVFDGSQPLNEDDYAIIDSIKNKKSIAIINKSDLGTVVTPEMIGGRCVCVSAKYNSGYNELKKAVEEVSEIDRISPDSVVLATERQRACAVKSLSAVSEAVSALNAGYTLDAVGVCVDDALHGMLELIGERVTNEVTDEVFRRFCVGK